jgi:hypothetical protein
MAGQVRHSEKRDRRGRQKLLIPTIDLSQNAGGVCRSFWMAGQDCQGGQKLLTLAIGLSQNVDGVRAGERTKKKDRWGGQNCSYQQ